MKNVLQTLYKSAYRLIYAHEGHVSRVAFILLNCWWFVLEVLPVRLYGLSPLTGHTSTNIAMTFICSIGVLVGVGLLLFRENLFFINSTYLITFVILLTGTLRSITTTELVSNFGLFAVAMITCVLSYFRYNIKRQGGFNAAMNKARLDNEQTAKALRSE